MPIAKNLLYEEYSEDRKKALKEINEDRSRRVSNTSMEVDNMANKTNADTSVKKKTGVVAKVIVAFNKQKRELASAELQKIAENTGASIGTVKTQYYKWKKENIKPKK